MNELFYTILEMSISASILVLVVLLLRLILKKAPKWVNVLLWALVAIRLICPFAIESPFSLMPDMDYLVVREATSYVDTGLGDFPDNIPEYVIGGNQVGDDVTVQTYPTDPITQINRGVNTQLILNIVWLSGVAAMLTYMIVSCICVYRRIQKSTQFRDNIYTSYAVTSPFVFGIVKPRIYLPESMDAVNMSYVIAHEEAHVRRRDHWWKPIGFILLAVHWFNPIIWLAYILLCHDIEMACDERVIRDMGERERVDYSEALLDCSVNRRIITACPLAFGENNVKERIRTVLNYKKPAFWIVVLAVIACAVAAICFLTNPQKNTVNTIHNVILYDTETKQEMYLYEYEKSKGVSAIKSAQIDLDNDRVFEEVLWLKRGSDENYGFLIVNFANDKAYAHELPYRAFMDLKDDGTFSFASSVSDHGIGRITFTGDTYTINKLAYSESDPDTQNISYYIEGEVVSKQEFDSYLDFQSKKQNVRLTGWVEEYANPDTEFAEENNMQNDNSLTLDKVVELSTKGQNLTWSDFADFSHTDVGSGLYIWHLPIDDVFSVSVGGGSIHVPPMYVYLCAIIGEKQKRIDIRDGGVEEFIENASTGAEIENIIYHSDRGGKAQALEDFYSDDKYDYYFPTIRSDVVIVYYKDGTEQPVKEALAEGKITITDLDRYSIRYYREPKQDYDPSSLLTVAEVSMEEPLNTEYYEYIHDQNEYTRYILISTTEKITDVRVTDIVLDDGMEFGDDLYTLPELDSKKPLLLGVVFYGDLTSYGIVFKDSDGITHRFIISESGKDGSFVVQEYNFFGGE